MSSTPHQPYYEKSLAMNVASLTYSGISTTGVMVNGPGSWVNESLESHWGIMRMTEEFISNARLVDDRPLCNFTGTTNASYIEIYVNRSEEKGGILNRRREIASSVQDRVLLSRSEIKSPYAELVFS